MMKTQCGFPQFLSQDIFKDPVNGYLNEDSCIFGAEVFVMKYSGKGECLSMIKEPVDATFSWVIENFSTLLLKEEVIYSDAFTVEDFKWHVPFLLISLIIYTTVRRLGDKYMLLLICFSFRKLILYPKGSAKTGNKSLSLFLELQAADCEILDNLSRLYAEYELITDQGNLGRVKYHGRYI